MLLKITKLTVAIFVLNVAVVFAGPLENCKEYTKYGVPGTDGDLLCRKGYLLAHDSYCLTPFWVAEHLTKPKASGALKRKDSFKADPNLTKGHRAELSDYKSSGFDRGHMAPSADMSWDAQAMKESFYLSNMVPQNPNMNQHIWKELEEKIRQWALDRGELYIYTGPIFAGEEIEAIGDNEVCVPTHIYKIVYDPKMVEAIAFIMPNEPLDPSDIPNYIVTIGEVEEQTGLDFLKNLTKSVEDVVETEKAQELW
ncbi:MAG: DNA/RNA non-specific [Geobacteraceae bacterium]|nr:MAG: DNA/RNA non-specific [Geobacteraceae bacterium]